MHISKSDTQHTEILTFEEAQKHREESAVYDREKWLYIPDFYSEYRYILGTAGKKPLITIGINPSTAEPDNLDRAKMLIATDIARKMPLDMRLLGDRFRDSEDNKSSICARTIYD